MNYKQITRAERVGISMLLKIGYSHNQIALELNRKQSTISREIKRNSNIDPTKGLLVYNPDYAHKKKKRVRVTVNKKQIKLEFESKKYPNLEKYIIEKSQWVLDKIDYFSGFAESFKVKNTKAEFIKYREIA